jgi:K+-transporting ATPase KdpF subunit
MDLENVILLAVSVAILGYLFFALFRPEKF